MRPFETAGVDEMDGVEVTDPVFVVVMLPATLPDVVTLSDDDADGLREPVRVAELRVDADGLPEVESEKRSDASGVVSGDVDVETDAVDESVMPDRDGDALAEVQTENVIVAVADTVDDCDPEGVPVPRDTDAFGDCETDTVSDVVPHGDGVNVGDADADGDPDAPAWDALGHDVDDADTELHDDADVELEMDALPVTVMENVAVTVTLSEPVGDSDPVSVGDPDMVRVKVADAAADAELHALPDVVSVAKEADDDTEKVGQPDDVGENVDDLVTALLAVA